MKIVIPGKPIAKQRPRFAKRGRFVTTYDPQENEKKHVRSILTAQLSELSNSLDNYKLIEFGKICSSQVFSVSFTFFLPINSSDSVVSKNRKLWGITKASTKPDYDNCEKFYLDCANGILWGDDSTVIQGKALKLYSEQPRVEIVVTAVNDVKLIENVERVITTFSPSELKELKSYAEKISQLAEPDMDQIESNVLEEWLTSTAVLLSEFANTFASKLTKISKLGDIKSEVNNLQDFKRALEA